MTQRFRWRQPLTDDADVTITRIVGDHELREGDAGADDTAGQTTEDDTGTENTARHRRYELQIPTAVGGLDGVEIAAIDADWEAESASGADEATLTVTVPDGAGLARIRLTADAERNAIRLPGPSFGETCTAAIRGDEEAARDILDAFESPVEIPFACGGFLGVSGVVELLEALVSASDSASDALHARRYDVVRGVAISKTGLVVDTATDFEEFVDGLDAIDGIGSVDAVDALGDVTAVCHGSSDETRRWLTDLGYDLARLERRDDGRFFAYYLAQIAATDGFRAVEEHVMHQRDGRDVNYDRAKNRAKNADYWDRGEAWRALVRPAVRRSLDEFAYVLANALYWTGEVSRTNARVDELLYEGAIAVAAEVGVDWIEGRARFERHRAAGHRHRSSRNHDLALSHFERAEAIAGEYDFLTPWEPIYSQAIVRSNKLSTAGRHDEAIAALEEGLAALDEHDVPESRAREMRHHLEGQRREREAILARKNAEDHEARLIHLEEAREHYAAIDFDRSVDRITRKLDDAKDDQPDESDESSETATTRGELPQPRLQQYRDSGLTLDDIPDLHDYLTEPDPTAVGSADPGVLPDERAPEPGDADVPPGRESDWY